MNNQEKLSTTPERERPSRELEKAASELRESLRERHERAGEQTRENLNEARQEALEKAKSIETQAEKPKLEHQPSPAERRADRPIGKAEREASFNTTMQEVRTHMSSPSRTFSKVIHNKAIEKVSDVAGNTVARPNAILSGAILAFALTLTVYLVAKNMGYPLSGFETIGAFAIGWVLGTVYDFLKVMVTGRK
jgi:vacuolar-type H+-ATPase subunit E/Vma4